MRRFPNTGKYMLVVAAGLLLAGCCRSNKISISQDVDDIPILLSVKSTGTKAIIDEPDAKKKMIMGSFDANNQNTGGFGVHGYKKVNNQAPFHLFSNTRVYPDLVSKPANLEAVEPNTQWTYSPLRFWDLTASYQFLAYWPILPAYDANQSSAFSVSAPDYPATVDDEILTIHNVPNWQSVDGDEIDLMTAVEVGRFSPEFYTGVVPLHFKHILSQLVIQAYYVGVDMESTGGVEINAIKLMQSAPDPDHSDAVYKVMEQGQTDFRQSYTDDYAQVVTSTLDMANDHILFQVTDPDPGKRAVFYDEFAFTYHKWDPTANNNEGAEVSATGPAEIGRWLMVPHKWKDLYVAVQYEKGGSPVSNQWNDDTPRVPVTIGEEHYDYVTQPGKTYTITLVFDTSGGGLTVKSVAVQNWSEQKTTHEVYNW